MWKYIIILIVVLLITYFLLFHFDTIKEYIIKYWKIIAATIIIGILYILWQSDIIEHNIQLGGSNKKTATIKFMQFNIENGGMLVDFSKVIDAIKLANPDIVAIEEANGNMKLIAEKAGFPYYDVRTQIMSQYPIIDPNDASGVYVFIEIEPNRVIVVSNVHLPSDPYGPDELHKGESYRKVTKLEKELRLVALQKQINILPKFNKLPIFLAGDFNAPSHLDCKKKEKEKCFTWPISLTLEKIGFIDAFREIYPDPNKEHGYTWWANRPKVKNDWNPTINDEHDRIDFVYVLGPVKTESCEIIGESHITPWPSDHRAIVFDFTVNLVKPFTYISVNKRLFNNTDTITIKYNICKNINININNEKIVIRKINHNNNLKEFSIQDTYGDIAINNNNLDPGHYEALLMLRDKILAKTPFSIVTQITEVTTDKKTYSIGEKIKVNWTNAPGNRFDWVVIKKEDAGENDDIIHWVKTGGTIYGSHTFQKNNTDEWPLNPGIYDVIYMIDDSHKSIVRTKIYVQ